MTGSGSARGQTTSPVASLVDGETKEPPEVFHDTSGSGNVPGSLVKNSSSAGASPKKNADPATEDDEISITKSLHLRRDWYSGIATFIAGGVAGAASRTLTAPLDRIKLIAQEGHLIQGPKPDSSATVACSAAGGRSASGSVSSTAQAVRQQHPGLLQVARMIRADGGWKAFWRGNTINCFKAGPEFAMVFSIRRYLSSLYEDCVEREKVRKKILLAQWNSMNDRSAVISCREQERTEFMKVDTEEPRGCAGVTALQSKVDGVDSSYSTGLPILASSVSPTASASQLLTSDAVRQREWAISMEASILPPPFHRLGCVSAVPQLAVNCTIGAVAGLGAQGILYPLEVVKTRVVVSRTNEYKGGVAEIVRLAYQKGGVMEFYRGFVPNMVGIIVYRGLEMGLYSSAQQSIMMYRMQVRKMNRHEASLNSAEVGVVGMFSSTVAQTVSYPLNVIRTRLQTQGTNGRAKKYTGMVDCMVKMIRNKGVTSLFSGLTANYLKAVPASACTFVVFEWVQRLLVDDN
ncbi:mitochondrial carrier protein-like protein [Leishmania tarentolae]|uniref:Mitochondrial carrier protein-like protein n=1 Tax=Leishmania tarentolae TaxID=5689 RepID=A0A640KS57_LEITA|nr:mitochondrial carrier protein-like protein [Leishmania tarentolae]